MGGLSEQRGQGLTNDVYVADYSGYGIKYYVVMVNGHKFDSFEVTGPRLTHSQMVDIADGYKEALDNYRSAMVESWPDLEGGTS